MKKLNKFFAILIALLICLSPFLNIIAESDNNIQISDSGGKSIGEGVIIEKTISPSNIENYFDITLKVQTTQIAQEQDIAVVIVMDISNTMIQYKVENSTKTRLRAALDAGKYFIDNFASNSSNVSSNRKIGYVAFNSNANQIFELQDCKDATSANKLKNSLETQTKNIVKDIDKETTEYKNSSTRFTNIEAGLKMAYDMLNENDETRNIKNKYVILISDGFPTTYIEEGYKGYKTERTDKDILYDHVLNRTLIYGTNYSERGARKAQEQATKLKDELDTLIYSVGSGLDANTLTIEDYEKALEGKDFSTLDRFDRNYAIGNTIEDFKQWLGGTGNSSKPGIGSGYENFYFDTSDTKSLEEAYDKIFEDITYLSEASWVAKDPMNSDESTVEDVIGFIGIYNNEGVLSDEVTYDKNIENNTSNNTAIYSDDTDKINWDLKKSKYYSETIDNITYYNYELKYRIRLKTEADKFESETILDTNGETTLSYVIKKSGQLPRLEQLEFKIPSVKGYLGTLKFDKITNYGNKPLEGTTFILYHSSQCECLDENKHMDEEFTMSSVSNQDGEVIFENIPSGHKYKIREDSTDEYHDVNSDVYDVEVSYGETISSLKDNQVINKYKSRDLIVSKVVDGVDTTQSFKFLIDAKYKEEPLEGTYEVIKKVGNKETKEKITFVNGQASINIKDKEQITIKNLPYGIVYTIKEINNEGFIVKYQIDNGIIEIYNSNNIKSYTLKNTMQIKFTNISGYELPATGSSGMLILIIIGSLLLIVPIIYISVNVLNKKLTIKH